MGPFPHDAAPAQITEANPAGTDGFEFVEFAGPDPEAIRAQFRQMGYAHVATHRAKAVELWQQGDVSYLLNAEPGGHAADFAADHGPCAPSMGWRVADAGHAFRHAMANGAEAYEGPGRTMDAPAIRGIGGSLIYFLDGHRDGSVYNAEFDWHAAAHPEGMGFHYLDHLTHNVHRGNMDVWFDFYGRLFNFREIRFFDIRGKHTGLISRALTSPCGRIRIPINEDAGEDGQIVEYLRRYQGRGHPAHRRRRARHLRGGGPTRGERPQVHAAAACDLLPDVARAGAGARRASGPHGRARHPGRRGGHHDGPRRHARHVDPAPDLLQDDDRARSSSSSSSARATRASGRATSRPCSRPSSGTRSSAACSRRARPGPRPGPIARCPRGRCGPAGCPDPPPAWGARAAARCPRPLTRAWVRRVPRLAFEARPRPRT